MIENAVKVLPDEVLDARVEDELVVQACPQVDEEQALDCC